MNNPMMPESPADIILNEASHAMNIINNSDDFDKREEARNTLNYIVGVMQRKGITVKTRDVYEGTELIFEEVRR